MNTTSAENRSGSPSGGRRRADLGLVVVGRDVCDVDVVLVRRVVGFDQRVGSGLRGGPRPHRDVRAVIDAIGCRGGGQSGEWYT